MWALWSFVEWRNKHRADPEIGDRPSITLVLFGKSSFLVFHLFSPVASCAAFSSSASSTVCTQFFLTKCMLQRNGCHLDRFRHVKVQYRLLWRFEPEALVSCLHGDRKSSCCMGHATFVSASLHTFCFYITASGACIYRVCRFICYPSTAGPTVFPHTGQAIAEVSPRAGSKINCPHFSYLTIVIKFHSLYLPCESTRYWWTYCTTIWLEELGLPLK
jgi:hypothetical protein